jgi:hypothetical protein
VHYVRRMQILQACKLVGQLGLHKNVVVHTRSDFAEESQSIDVWVVLNIADGISVIHPMTDLWMT